MGAELVGHAQDKLLAITFEVVVRDGGGIRPGGVRHAITSSIAGEAGNEEGEMRWLAGEDANKDGGCHEKFIDLLSFGDEGFIIGWIRPRLLVFNFFCHEACTRCGEEELAVSK